MKKTNPIQKTWDNFPLFVRILAVPQEGRIKHISLFQYFFDWCFMQYSRMFPLEKSIIVRGNPPVPEENTQPSTGCTSTSHL